ncbi:reverse transcriptase family protein [Bacillus thuringiensis]|uniref:reverse transcriptase family protein n=1 Tax=Bacillus thuringiensis TaxID=1428 RepID=UPI0001A20FD4|nr:reverse transcriptase family protein [Bacillus thuringiensis]EEM91485.1 Retron-type reverse transcriptase [Bacillus thuringiensis serovar pulsiensis BGSC 4CC1]
MLGIEKDENFKIIIEKKANNYKNLLISRKGKQREIKCINKESQLYRIQANLVQNFLNEIPLPDNVCGFVKKRSYRDFLVPHINNSPTDRYYLRLDIKDFFDSITEEKIEKSLQEYVTINDGAENKEVLKDIIDIVTLNGCLPQGGVTSPVISNIIFRRLDIRIRKYCSKLNITYSRYADDMLFSSQHNRLFDGFFVKMIAKILKDSNFVLNRKKIKKGVSFISLNGFVVGKNIRISRKKRQDINRFIFLFEKGGNPKDVNELLSRLNKEKFYYRSRNFESKSSVIDYLAGYRSMLISWIPEDSDEAWKENVKNLLDKIQKIIMKIEYLK